ncbi:MAG TPA: hypothetical protein VEA58_02820, partial [Anaerovoracaceae bacterium]|nr:hypothetical protein [Anaerovoracaceae bacterium]
GEVFGAVECMPHKMNLVFKRDRRQYISFYLPKSVAREKAISFFFGELLFYKSFWKDHKLKLPVADSILYNLMSSDRLIFYREMESYLHYAEKLYTLMKDFNKI